jgi:hypothetical protein
MPSVHYDRGQGPREAAPARYHSTTYVRDGAEAARVAARLAREQAPKEREPGEDDDEIATHQPTETR